MLKFSCRQGGEPGEAGDDAGAQRSSPRVQIPALPGVLALFTSRGAARRASWAESDPVPGAVTYRVVVVLRDNSAAEDVVQDVFVELSAHPDRYHPAAGTLRTYLIVLAKHRAVDVVRSELRRIARQERCWRLTPAPSAADAGEAVMAAETATAVRTAVQLLPASQQQVVELAYFGGLTCREIAHAVGMPEGTAKSRLRLALAKLEEMLDRQLLESP